MSVLTKVPAGTRTGATIGRLVDGMELWGVDLRTLPTLAEQLARLDAALGDPDEYAEVWLDIQAELAGNKGGAGATLMWMPEDGEDAEPRLYGGGICCDDQEPERILRSDAIRDHRPADQRYFDAIVRSLLRRRHYSDNRDTPRRAIIRAVRGVIETRGRLMINPDGKLELTSGWPAKQGDDRDETAIAQALEAGIVLHRIARRWKARPVLKRIVRRLGKPISGFLVLEAAR